MDSVVFVTQHSEKLADIAEELLNRVPVSGEWSNIRGLLARTSEMMRRGEVRSGLYVFKRVARYLQSLLESTDKTIDLNGTYQIVENINSHFLVDPNAKKVVENLMKRASSNLTDIRTKLEQIAEELDYLLFECNMLQIGISWRQTISLAFKFNRLAADIHSCEDLLQRIKIVLCELDTHVGTKKLFATAISWLSAFGGLVAFTSGNAAAGSVCFTLSKLTDKARKDLENYKENLHAVTAQHLEFEHDLSRLKAHYTAERKNFLLLTGLYFALPISFFMMLMLYFTSIFASCCFLMFSVLASLVIYKQTVHVIHYDFPLFLLGVMCTMSALMYMNCFYGLVLLNGVVILVTVVTFCEQVLLL